MKLRNTFVEQNARLTKDVVGRLARAVKHTAVIAEAPPGAGKSTLTASVAKGLVDSDRKLRLAVVTQTNEQADDLVTSLVGRGLAVGRIVGGTGPSDAMNALVAEERLVVSDRSDSAESLKCRVIVGTARKWEYERSRMQEGGGLRPYPVALIDEAYQMRSDALLGIADLFETLFCVGDPGQLDPFTVVDDSLWKGLKYSPSRTALGTLREYHPRIEPIRLPTSWRLPPSAASMVAEAFYPYNSFQPGTSEGDRKLDLGKATRRAPASYAIVEHAAKTGWGYIELPEKFTVRTDDEIASTLAANVAHLLKRGATVVDELHASGRPLDGPRIAVVAAHNDQVHAVRYALSQAQQDPDAIVVSTANKIQGREYDVVFVWHPLAGRRDATAFHLEAGRMCVMLSRHRHACVVVGRAGAGRLLAEFPDTDPVFLDEPEKFPDGWQANHTVLQHLAKHRDP